MSEEGTQGPHCTETVGPYPKISNSVSSVGSTEKQGCKSSCLIKSINLWDSFCVRHFSLLHKWVGLLGQNDPWTTRKVQMHRGWNWLRHSCLVLSGCSTLVELFSDLTKKFANMSSWRKQNSNITDVPPCTPMEKTRHIVTSCLVPQTEKMLMRTARTALNPASSAISQLHELHTKFPQGPGLELDQTQQMA